MPRVEIDALLHVLRQGFDGDIEHSLIANLGAVRDEDWHALPQGGSRSIYDIVVHVAECKWMYDNYAFGDGSLRWGEPPIKTTTGEPRSPEELLAWTHAGQAQLVSSIRALDSDEELDRERPLNWGEMRATRGIILTMIEHDLYHSGEANHVRSLLQGEDRWAFDP
jgi:uncharacterized damage-inducible protein DinB